MVSLQRFPKPLRHQVATSLRGKMRPAVYRLKSSYLNRTTMHKWNPIGAEMLQENLHGECFWTILTCETRQQRTARHKTAGFAWRRSDLGLGLYGHGQAQLCSVPAVTCVPTVRMLSMKSHRFFSGFPSFVDMRWHPEEGHKYIGVCPIRPVQLYGRSP